jgi:predicted phosphodiesterase
MRLAFLADIHGNLPALEAVIADLHTQAPDAVYLVGDQINRCPWNNEVLDALAGIGWPAIYGNHDWVVGKLGEADCPPVFADRARFPSLWWTHDTLQLHHLGAIRRLPAELLLDLDGGPAIRMFHGAPANPFVGLYPYAPTDRLVDAIRSIDEPIIVAGHIHRPMDRTVNDGRGRKWRIFNGGSVGLPYNEDPRAQYLILDSTGNGWSPRFRAVEYDHSILPAAFATSGMLNATGAMGELHLRTAMTGQPWSSDFGQWINRQPAETRTDMAAALERYLALHGPGNWAFLEE